MARHHCAMATGSRPGAPADDQVPLDISARLAATADSG